MIGSVFYRWGTTHILATVNHETVAMYRRLGFKIVDEKHWIDSIGNHIVPLIADAKSYYQWAFGNIPTNGHPNISDNFERLLLRSGEVIFSKGDDGQYAFIVDEGQIRINGSSPAGDVLTLATIGPGELFGELSLIDDHPRNASALALTDAELIILDRHAFNEISESDSDTLDLILRTMAARTRRIDDMALVFAYEPLRKRMEFAYNEMRERAIPQRKDPRVRILKLAPQEFASYAGVDADMALSFLKSRQARGEIELRSQTIRFVA
ncbi:MAG: Crp/Fnr family transcriptional regulator [gamma proteobacterium symbiont of Bathyaustriella thionipta]|nr:Crp/Fnr family transcriptional regulator [gamma proteobacterium symbiont of Bathyaustriella thionipta]